MKKNLPCNQCEFVAQRQDRLNEHRKVVHEGFRCVICTLYIIKLYIFEPKAYLIKNRDASAGLCARVDEK